jgi:hypothetical protein
MMRREQVRQIRNFRCGIFGEMRVSFMPSPFKPAMAWYMVREQVRQVLIFLAR